MPGSCARARAPARGFDTIDARGEALLGAPLDPIAPGARLRVSDAAGATLFDGDIGPGAPGWRPNGGFTRWTFKDPAGSAASGITKLTLRDRSSRSPGVLAFKITARAPAQGPSTPALPLTLRVGIGVSVADRCAGTAFASDACELRSAGRVARCR